MTTHAFDFLEKAAPDPIFEVDQRYKADPFVGKISLGVGAYRDESGNPWTLPSVRGAEEELHRQKLAHEYLPITGLDSLCEAGKKLAFGEFAEQYGDRICTVQSLSGTGSLRVLAEFIHHHFPNREVLVSDPTWGTHFSILKMAYVPSKKYRYYNDSARDLDWDGLREDLRSATDGSIVLFHSCAHNPTGMDPTEAQWKELAQLCIAKKFLVWFDSAYQGFASGSVEKDRFAVIHFAQSGIGLFLSQSFAKNFGVYGERAGLVHVLTSDADVAVRVKSQLAIICRPMYSNPPLHGARIVSLILNDPARYKQWLDDIRTMASRMAEMRTLLVQNLKELKTPGDWSHITKQIGMFSYTGLSPPQVERMEKEFHIYLLKSGRISIAGINRGNVKTIAEAIHRVVTESKL